MAYFILKTVDIKYFYLIKLLEISRAVFIIQPTIWMLLLLSFFCKLSKIGLLGNWQKNGTFSMKYLQDITNLACSIIKQWSINNKVKCYQFEQKVSGIFLKYFLIHLLIIVLFNFIYSREYWHWSISITLFVKHKRHKT